MSLSLSTQTPRKRSRSEELEENTKPGKTVKMSKIEITDEEDYKGNIIKLFQVMTEANKRSEKNEKRLDSHDDRLTRIEKHLLEIPQNQAKQQDNIADAVAKAMLKRTKDTVKSRTTRRNSPNKSC